TPSLADYARERDCELVHAWGIQAARAAGSSLRELPLLVTLMDPACVAEAAQWLHALPGNAVVATSSQVTRASLITHGLVPERLVVIRGLVDFGDIARAKKSEVRREMVDDAAPVVLMSGPPTRSGGQYVGLWAAAIVKQVYRHLRVICPYESRES